ncbi:MAG TPA: hypothetical protein VMH28_26950 [Candidatus Acidoferrales bacterium]|nr:hypothetical protein [Candidatus Acidoferrales bacterium]
MPWVPPYLGSWEQLIDAVLHDPTLGSGRGKRPYVTHLDAFEENRYADPPPPRPWTPAASYLLSAISTLVAAESLPDGAQKTEVIGRANQVIDDFIDDFCGTPPHPWPFPWPWPGPAPWVMPVVSELTVIANGFQQGAMRDAVQAAAGKMLQKALSSTGVGNPGSR